MSSSGNHNQQYSITNALGGDGKLKRDLPNLAVSFDISERMSGEDIGSNDEFVMKNFPDNACCTNEGLLAMSTTHMVDSCEKAAIF